MVSSVLVLSGECCTHTEGAGACERTLSPCCEITSASARKLSLFWHSKQDIVGATHTFFIV